MMQQEMQEYLAQGFQVAFTAELRCKQCGDFRVLLPENHSGKEFRCPVCAAAPCPVYPFGGLCLTKRQLPAFHQVRVASYIRPSSFAELSDLVGK